MFAFLLPIIMKVFLPDLLEALVKSAIITPLEAGLAKDAVNFNQALSTIKIYREYPSKPNDPFGTENPGG